jgi:uncharacterized protein (DUF486 family)
MPQLLQSIGLLIISNTFMTIAWYGHLKHRNWPLVVAILISWLIAFFEYVFQVPANRISYGKLSLMQLKILQECITLVVFVAYATIAFKQPPRWNTAAAMACIVAAVVFAFWGGFAEQK